MEVPANIEGIAAETSQSSNAQAAVSIAVAVPIVPEISVPIGMATIGT